MEEIKRNDLNETGGGVGVAKVGVSADVNARCANVGEAQTANSVDGKQKRAADVEMTVEESVLQFLAEEHPDDEGALSELTEIFDKARGIADRNLIELAYKGMRYDADMAAARNSGYVDGRNETIELERQALADALPKDDGGLPETEADDLPLLRHIRRSVWDD